MTGWECRSQNGKLVCNYRRTGREKSPEKAQGSPSRPQGTGRIPLARRQKDQLFNDCCSFFSAFYATNRDIVRHLRYAPIVRPLSAHFRVLIYALFYAQHMPTFGRRRKDYLRTLNVQKEDLPELPLGRSLENVTSEPSFLMRLC